MAERTVSVKLAANVAGYEASMRQAAASSAQFSTATQSSMTQLGGQMSAVGGTMTRALTLPLVAAGAGAVKLGLDFDTAFSKMVGLAGVAAGEVDGLKESVLALAGRTGQAPVDLANALYEASSAGLDTAEAMAAVEVAAMGAAAGMGSAEDIVGLVASATASYGAANITASEAVDVLTQTIREGRADPEELAGSLGRILPVASQLGVSFAEVGGIVAYMSTVIGDTDRAVTGVNDALVKLASPTQGAKEVLFEMGTSAVELHAAISEKGLLGGLQLLRDHGFAGNAEAIRRLMPDMQGAVTLTTLLNDESGTLTETMQNVQNSTGALGEAFATAAESDMFKMKQAWAELQVALIEASDVIIPIVSGIVGFIGDLASAFSDLPGPVQTLIIGFLGIVAAAGPLLKLGGSVITLFSSLDRAAGAAVRGFAGISQALGGMGAVLGPAAVAVVGLGMYFKDAADDAAELSAAIGDLARASDAELVEQFYTTLAKAVAEGSNWGETLARIAQEQPGVVARMLEMEDATGAVTDALIGSGLGAEDAASMIEALRGAMANEAVAADNAATTTAAAEDALGGIAVQAQAADAALLPFVGTLDATAIATEGAAHALEEQGARVKAVADAIQEHTDALEEQYSAQRSAIDSEYAMNDAIRAASAAVADANALAQDSSVSTDELAIAYEDAAQAALKQADAEVRRAEDLATASGQTLTAEDKNQILIDSLSRQAWVTDGPVRDALLAHIDTLEAIPPGKATEIEARGIELAKTRIGEHIAKLGQISEAELTWIQTSIDQGDYDAVERKLAVLSRPRSVTISPKYGAVQGAIPAIGAFAAGGTVGPGGGIGGESGPEHVQLPGGGQAFIRQPTWLPPGSLVTPVGALGSGQPGGGTTVHEGISIGTVTVARPVDLRRELEQYAWLRRVQSGRN